MFKEINQINLEMNKEIIKFAQHCNNIF